MEEKIIDQMQDLKEKVKEDAKKIIELLTNLSKEMELQNELLGTISTKIDAK